MYLVKPLSRDKAKRADTECICPFPLSDSLRRKGQIHYVSARPLVPGEGLYQIHGQSLNTHRGKHRSGTYMPLLQQMVCHSVQRFLHVVWDSRLHGL